jgi:hypothetical protein
VEPSGHAVSRCGKPTGNGSAHFNQSVDFEMRSRCERARLFFDDAWVIEILIVSSLLNFTSAPTPTSARSPASARPCDALRGVQPWRESAVRNFCFLQLAAASSSGSRTCSNPAHLVLARGNPVNGHSAKWPVAVRVAITAVISAGKRPRIGPNTT